LASVARVTSVEDILDKLYFSATDERDKGDKFERMMLQYFKTDVVYAERFSDVFMWMDWPQRAGSKDNGIDLVAIERETGDAVAIQCKFFDPGSTLYKQHIDSFLSESGKNPFRGRIVVSTTDQWGPNAEAAIHDQQIPVERMRFMDLAESSIDWSQFDLETPEVMEIKGRKQLRPHQIEALEAVRAGLATRDRGKLIMACGTGKTFTSLRIAEDLVPLGGKVLFLVPSIALLSQSLREWSIEAEHSLRTFAVCSDVKVGKKSANATEDISSVDLAHPSTTNPTKLAARLRDTEAGQGRITVVFSTYQSIDVVAQAQKAGSGDFDMIICDEAHRTTGATLAQSDESAFTRVHEASYIKASKRLYMTATPRIYDDASKIKAGQAHATLASMDDEDLFGPELHRLGFGEAVSRSLLTDYKVLVLAVDEGSVSRTFQNQFAEHGELKLDDVAKIVGCWNGMAKRGRSEHGFETDPAPMRRAVAFAKDIKSSKQFADMFEQIVVEYTQNNPLTDEERDAGVIELMTDAHHVDGTYNILKRNTELDWLKADTAPDQARILSNARCLSEGVDVPALDAVMFLNPRKSVVDVVQSVGRVMRLAPGKKYGYIILPIGIPAGMTPEDALRDNEKYKVVWEVLQALRAHDERFDAMVNKIELNKARDERIQVIGVGGGPSDRDDQVTGGSAGEPGHVQGMFDLAALDQWREAIYAKIVTKVGSRRYWEDWAKDVAKIAEQHRARLLGLIESPDVASRFAEFLTALRGNLNESIRRDDAIDMLSQHLITKPVFDALFEDHAFTEHNPVSLVMQGMLDTLEGANLEAETAPLESFYNSVRQRAAGIDNAEGKQRIITDLYEKFFKLAFPRAADALGIVYTPVPVVDFILRSVDHLLREQFGTSLSGEGVHVLDPFTGTGTFIVRLLQSGLVTPEDLARKYASELHANELMLLAYYIAAINIETTFHDITHDRDGDGAATYVPFDGIVLTDTFQMTEDGDLDDGVVFTKNNDRVLAQKALDIRVIVGNPPYSVGQTSGNDNNANFKYPTLDTSIEKTYAARSSATNKNSLYDSYIRAIRWASDRIGDSGIIGFVTNGGFIDANTTDGLRKTLADEFTSIYIYNLRGNARTAGAQRQKEKGNVFGSGARTTVAVTFLVKNPAQTGRAVVKYADIGDYLTAEQKLDIVDTATIDTVPWQAITPNDNGDWTNQRSTNFDTYTPIATKHEKSAVFSLQSPGLQTNRDAWVYNYSKAAVAENVGRMTVFYNSQVDDFAELVQLAGLSNPKDHLADFINTDPTKISWSSSLIPQVARGRKATFSVDRIVEGAYRPFARHRVYFDELLNHRTGSMAQLFPTPAHENFGFYIVGTGSDKPFSTLATSAIPDLSFWGSGSGQFFARYTFELVENGQLAIDEADIFDGYRRVDNITDSALAEYRTAYGPGVAKDDIFVYVYALLHSPDYRTQFAADLKRTLPRIPKVPAEHFDAFVTAGRRLMDLHINYEAAARYPLTLTGEPEDPTDPYAAYRVEKMKWKSKADKSTLIYSSRITVSGIPDVAHDYMLGSRSAIEWLIDRYQVKTDKASIIVNDPNDWSRETRQPRYILDLVAKIVTVSVETVAIVKGLPAIDFA